MGIGAVFGAILTMYTAVASRAREIATLRAIGFNATAVVVSVLVESLALGGLGGVVGGLAAYLGFNGYQTSTMNFQTFSQVAFAFRVTRATARRGPGLCAAPRPRRRPAAGDPRRAPAAAVGPAGALTVVGGGAGARRRTAVAGLGCPLSAAGQARLPGPWDRPVSSGAHRILHRARVACPATAPTR